MRPRNRTAFQSLAGPKRVKVARVAVAVAMVALGIVVANVATPHGFAATNPITIENAKPGTAIPTLDSATAGQIQGYASAQSINVGQSLPLRISSNVGAVDLHVYRLGWYGGANSREVTVATNVPASSRVTPAPDANGTVTANWPVTYTLNTDSSWVSGLYVIGLNRAGVGGPAAFLPFAIRNDASTSAFIYVAPFNTYQGYNGWGGKSLYNYNSTNSVPAVKVSFDRPYDSEDGAGLMLEGDAYTVQFLEREGYDVSYAASSDLENSSLINNHRAYLSSFHDEYWTAAMRATVENAVTAGKHAAFMGANTMYWQVRYESASDGRPYRTMVGYKGSAALDPVQGPTTTTQFRLAPVNKPENGFLGSMYEGDFAYGNSAPWTVANASHWMYNGTGLANGNQIPKMVGYEWDRVFDNGTTPPGVVPLSDSTPQAGARQQATIYQKGNALVFNAGTIYWPWMLSNTGWGIDTRVQQMTRNLLAAMLDPNGPPTTTSPPTTVPPAQTVVRTWDFEDGTTQGWSTWFGNGVTSRVTTGTHGGSGALRTTTGTQYATAFVGIVGLVPGQTYTVLGYIRNDAATFNLGLVQFYTSTATSAAPDLNLTFTPEATGGWTRFDGTFVLPATAATVYIGINGGQSPMTLDDITIATPTTGGTTTTATPTTTTTAGPTTTTTAGPTTTTTAGPTTTTTTTTTIVQTSSCSVDYVKAWDNGVAFGVQIAVTKFGTTTNGWTLTWTFPNDQAIDIAGAYGGTVSQSGPNVTFFSAPWNGNIGNGARADMGFSAVYSTGNAVPATFRLNGQVCTLVGGPTTTTTTTAPTTTTTQPVTTTTTIPGPTTTTTTTSTTTTTATTVPPSTLVNSWLFEDGRTTNWTASSPSVLRISKTARTGGRSLSVSGGTATLTLDSFITRGRIHTVTAWVNSGSPTPSASVLVGNSTRINAIVDAPINGWRRITVRFTASSSSSAASLQISTGSSFFVDDVTLERN